MYQPPNHPPPQSLTDWLAHCERLHPKAIDMGLERVREVAARMRLQLECPVITVAGTNGKGSTCAMLEAILLQAGYRTGVYTSPHLVRFEERCRLRGEAMSAADFVAACTEIELARVQKGLEISLTYFEFTTLAILRVMQRAGLDVAILEVGLGGRLDAVNIIDADCAVITSIDLDHTELLGSDREAIGLEKAGIMRAGRPVVVSDPVPPLSVINHAAQIGADLWRLGQDFNFSGDKLQWGWVGRAADAGPPRVEGAPAAPPRPGADVLRRRYSGMAYPALRGANQLLNASGVLAALEALRDRIPVTAQAVRNGLALVELPGRFQIVAGQPTVVLDVAHNPHAVAALAENLDAMGFFPGTHAVFGAMADKDFGAMFERIAPLVDSWYFTDLPTARAAAGEVLRARLQADARYAKKPMSVHANPQAALDAALVAAQAADRIVVFGSFYTVGGVLHSGVGAISRRLTAAHVGAAPAAPVLRSAPDNPSSNSTAG